MPFLRLIADAVGVSLRQVQNTAQLLTDGATVPFISRYRKEMTGNLDEVKVQEIKDLLARYQELQERKQTILKTIEEQGALTAELQQKIEQSWQSNEVEDLYLPYKPKRKTRAVKARENGLEPLANILLKQNISDPEDVALRYVNDNVPSASDALQGARDIIAEQVSEDTKARDAVRREFSYSAQISTHVVKGKEPEGEKYADYFNFSEKLSRCPSHRVLAMRRAEREGVLRVNIAPTEADKAVERINRSYVRGSNAAAQQVRMAVADAYSRLLEPQIETEFAAQSKEKADTEAIRVFADNLRQLLLAPPLGQKRILALDPGFRTGCKLVCLGAQGELLHHCAIFPHQPVAKVREAAETVKSLIDKYKIEAIAIGDGTASRETEDFVRKLAAGGKLEIYVVSEDGASIYSASKTARDEFPDQDVTVRGAVSIGRRLMDPLAELVKIDPKSIGVGQYQHDVDQQRLRESLEATVVSCVNAVGVDLNTASSHLLTFVSGLGPTLAKNIVDYRTQNGPFASRTELKKVPRLGPKAFEQSAGFLRIRGAKNPLDNSAVHPEQYHIVRQMAVDLGATVEQLIASKDLRNRINIHNYVSDSVGVPTLTDILAELEKPGRDPRQKLESFAFDPMVHTINDLRTGQLLPGIVSNITAFGAFVDVGVKCDGLVHISRISDHFVRDVNEVVRLRQHVVVRVDEVDLSRNRIQLSMKGVSQNI